MPARASNQEGRVLLALQAYKRGQVSSLRKASVLYTVPFSSLQDRYRGRTTRENAQNHNRKLTSTEESVLIQWILSMNERGRSPRVTIVRETVNLILINQDNFTTLLTVSECWTKRFINRYPELKTRFS
jgi:hypothetical protein